MNYYRVDRYWIVRARNEFEAKKTLGGYHDLPREWYDSLQVEFLGLTGNADSLFSTPVIKAA